MDALYIAATGMRSQQNAVDTIANNLANVQTPTFKRSSISFQELMYREAVSTEIGVTDATNNQLTQSTGLGVSIRAQTKVFEQGELRATGNSMDLALRGQGLIEISMPDGTTGYSRGGTFKVSKDGVLTTATGHPLKQSIYIPIDAEDITISPQGRVTAKSSRKNQTTEVGQIELVRFLNSETLTPLGDGLYKRSMASSEAIAGKPGEQDLGLIAQGYVEGSNVRLVDEMIALVVAQRAYQANSKVIQAADEMMGMTNSLRRTS